MTANKNLSEMDKLLQRFEEMEIKIAFQDDLISALNDQITSHNKELSQLWIRHKTMHHNLTLLQENLPPDYSEEETPPPHY